MPLKVRDKAIGTLKFYYRHSRDVNRTQYALATGFADLISTQLAIHELELQDELTAPRRAARPAGADQTRTSCSTP